MKNQKKDKIIKIPKSNFQPPQQQAVKQPILTAEELAKAQEYDIQAQIGFLNKKINPLILDMILSEFFIRSAREALISETDESEKAEAQQILEQYTKIKSEIQERLRVFRQMKNEISDRRLEI